MPGESPRQHLRASSKQASCQIQKATAAIVEGRPGKTPQKRGTLTHAPCRAPPTAEAMPNSKQRDTHVLYHFAFSHDNEKVRPRASAPA
jgi:hypothetical protein